MKKKKRPTCLEFFIKQSFISKTIFLRLFLHNRLTPLFHIFHHQHPNPPQSELNIQTPDFKWAVVIIFILIAGISMKITIINGFCSIPKKIQDIIHPYSKFRSGLCLDFFKYHRQKQSIPKGIIRLNSSLKTKLK